MSKSLIYNYSRVLLGVNLLLHFFRLERFGFILSLWFFVTQAVSSIGSILWVGLKANPMLTGYFHKVCNTTALSYVAGRTGCRTKALLVLVNVNMLNKKNPDEVKCA